LETAYFYTVSSIMNSIVSGIATREERHDVSNTNV
jgi:hypothetical protein